ncbi:MAG: SF0329 family protein [Bradymonadia bacterium]
MKRSKHRSYEARPFSKLQKELYKLISKDIRFQIHCVVYPMRTWRGSTDLPRYFATLDKEIIWDYPANFMRKDGFIKNYKDEKNKYYPQITDIMDISDLIREYIDTPKEELFSKCFENDKWGLTNILKAADRRIGARRLGKLKRKTHNIAARKVLERRLSCLQKSADGQKSAGECQV